MTSDLEKQFFETFGIEPKMLCDCEFKNLYDFRIEYGQDVCIHMDEGENPCQKCELAAQKHPLYPEITDRRLLELICICCGTYFRGFSISERAIDLLSLKVEVLRHLMDYRGNFDKREIQQLFAEGEE